MNRHDSISSTTPPAGRILPVPPHEDAAVEWWFVHGNFSTGQDIAGHFMLSFFRHAVNGSHGFSMLFRIEDSLHRDPFIVSRADPHVQELLVRSREELQKTNLYGHLLNVYFDEVDRYGFPSAQFASGSRAHCSDDGLSISWDDFYLKVQDGLLSVGFRPSWADTHVQFILSSRTSAVDLGILETPGTKMGYLTYPICSLSGCYNSQPATGNAWFDRQWGDMSWFASESDASGQRRIQGWDWLGINLDDGRAAVVLISRDMETRNMTASNFVMIDPQGAVRKLDRFQIEPIASWQSPKTFIVYPVAWKMIIPALNGEIIFTPHREDQEIPVAGATRAIWEGAGRVTGTLEGKPVSATARLELNGYGCVFHPRDILDSFSRRIVGHIQNFFPESPDEAFYKKHTGLSPERDNIEAVREFLTRPIWDLLRRGGKHWRPMFGILMAEALGLDAAKYEDLIAVSTELTHLASLVIDDIEDNAETRRNDACIHLKYGTNIAINAANALYFLPITKLRENPLLTQEQLLAIYSKTMEFFVKAHFGQGMDLYRKAHALLSDRADIDFLIRDTLSVYKLKTAAPIEFIAHSVCLIAGADASTTRAAVELAENFGVAFQIKDDIHDFSGSEKWTKDRGSDLANGKLTYVILLALKTLTGEDRQFLIRLLRGDAEPEADSLRKGMELVRASGALEQADTLVFSMLNEAWEKFAGATRQSDARILLKVMCEHLLNLDYNDPDLTQ